MNKKIQIWLPLLISIAVTVGMLIGYKLKDTQPGKKFFSIDKPRPLEQIMNLIQHKYVDDVKMNALSDSAIMAVLQTLDPHSVYIPAEDLLGVNEDIAGNFFGIGIEFNIIEDTLHVINVITDGPSARAGIEIGDKFISVNDSLITGEKTDAEKVRKLLRGDLGTKAVVTLIRKGKLQTVTIVRGIIPVSSVDASYIIDNGIGFIRLNKFSQVTYREFMQALEGLQKQGLKKLILDLRGNGGGVLDEATALADEFLDGDKLITYTEGKHIPKKEYRCVREGLFEKGDLVILADEGSASASEVLMGALQDWDRAIIVGRRSFGKGLVQEQYDLSDGSALRLTVARYYTPLGRSIQRPYNNGEQAYYDEINKRFHSGEGTNADSVKNDTTKTFASRNGKKLYGSGGITPDIFIPVDTAAYDPAISKLLMKGTISDFAYRFYLQNISSLSAYKTPADFIKHFSFDDKNWNQFTADAAKDSIVLSTLQQKDKQYLVLRIKSSLARQIWRNEGFFEMMNQEDTMVIKAIDVLLK